MKELASTGRTASSSLDPSSEEVVEALCVANDELLADRPRRRGQTVLPSREAIALIVDDLRAVLVDPQRAVGDAPEPGPGSP